MPVSPDWDRQTLLETVVLFFRLLNLFNIRILHAAVSGFLVVVSRVKKNGLPADIHNSSSCFDWLNHGDELVLSKTGFTHNDIFRWLIEHAWISLNVNGTIMRGSYSQYSRYIQNVKPDIQNGGNNYALTAVDRNGRGIDVSSKHFPVKSTVDTSMVLLRAKIEYQISYKKRTAPLLNQIL